MEKTQHGGEHKQLYITVGATAREVKRKKDTTRRGRQSGISLVASHLVWFKTCYKLILLSKEEVKNLNVFR